MTVSIEVTNPKSTSSKLRKHLQLSIRQRLNLLFFGFVIINLVTASIGGLGLNRVRNNSPLLNTFGSKRMLTYRLAYLANVRDRKSNLDRIAINVSIKEDIRQFEKLLTAMYQGSTEIGLAPVTEPTTLAQLHKIENTWRIYRQKLEKYLTASQKENEYLDY